MAQILVPSTPITVTTVRGKQGDFIDVYLVNQDVSQSIDVSVWKTFDALSIGARASDEQFTAIGPGETRVGKVTGITNGMLVTFSAQASGAGNAPLQFWTSQ